VEPVPIPHGEDKFANKQLGTGALGTAVGRPEEMGDRDQGLRDLGEVVMSEH